MTSLLITYLASADADVLLYLNSMHTPWLDSLMLFLTNKWLWMPLSVLLAGLIVKREGPWRGLLCILMCVMAVALADRICAGTLRPVFERLRPSNLANPISQYVHVVNDYRGGRFGFPSCHAATAVALVVYLSLVFRNRRATLALAAWALLLCYTRIYLGVHYPGDLLFGSLVGTLLALPAYLAYRRLRSLRVPRRTRILRNAA